MSFSNRNQPFSDTKPKIKTQDQIKRASIIDSIENRMVG